MLYDFLVSDIAFWVIGVTGVTVAVLIGLVMYLMDMEN